jgi:tetratricopeptide (TPR) repeat protein
MASQAQPRWTITAVCVLLVAITWIVFGQARRFEFVNYDDDLYVYDNVIVSQGVTWPGVKWAFTSSHARNWHPLTTISHMVDCQLYGRNAGGHHVTNVLLHALNAILLFLVLRNMTGSTWRSAFVAALFAIHPQHVESVAWISERKDVLSGLFFILTLAAYVRYARHPSTLRYVTMSFLFVCGLMSKPMLVTLPFVLLLLDYWPLGRFAQSTAKKKTVPRASWWDRQSVARKLFIEKIPLLLFSAATCVVTYLIQIHFGALSDPLPLQWRIGSAVVSYATYIWQMLWPAALSPLYPHPEEQLPFWKIAAALIVVLALTVVAIMRRRKNPYLFTAWFWYLGMLVPVIGIVQVGTQGWADRYTYLPLIGLYVGVTWFAVDLTTRFRYRREIGVAMAALVLGFCLWVARQQTSFWKNSESLWTRALAVTTGNHVAHNSLGVLAGQRGRLDDALAHYQAALEIRARSRTFRHDFLLAVYHTNVAGVLRRKSQPDEAIRQAREALELQPNYGQALRTWADALVDKGQFGEAIPIYRQVAEIYRASPEIELSLAGALLHEGMDEEALRHFERALEFDAKSLTALNNLAWLYATNTNPSIRNGSRAVTLAARAVEISGGKNPFYLHKLAAAYAERQDFPNALAVADVAQKLATEEGNTALARELQRNIDIYRTNSPLRDNRRPR